jgi:hypothetical protein
MNNSNVSDEVMINATTKMKIIKATSIGEISRKDASNELGYSYGWVCAMVKQFRLTPNIEMFIHKGNGSKKRSKITLLIKKQIIEEYRESASILKNANYEGLNFTDFTERMCCKLGFDISDTSIKGILNEALIISPRAKPRATKNANLHISDKSRDGAPGREIQMDGTFCFSLPGETRDLCCHLAVDANSNVMLGAYIEYEETTNGYFKCLEKVLKNYGIPKKIVSDNRSTFNNNVKQENSTTFTRAIGELDIEIETSSNARRKNKVESKNDVFKDRVMKELVLRGVTTISEAELEIESVLELVNNKLENVIDFKTSEFTKFDNSVNLDILFAAITQRTIQRDNTITIDNINYIIHQNDKVLILNYKSKVEVISNFKGEIKVRYHGILYETSIATDEKLNTLVVENQRTEKRKISSNDSTFSITNQSTSWLTTWGTFNISKLGLTFLSI